MVGRRLTLNGTPHTIVGVAPEGFEFPSGAIDLWRPFGWDPAEPQWLRRPHMLRAIGRLKPDVSIDQARGEMTAIASRLEEEYPETNTLMGVGLGPLQEWLVGDARPALLVFPGAVGCVLLIAGVNVANPLLAATASRRRELAIRSALGAGRVRIIRQLLLESLLLAGGGAVLGTGLANWMITLLQLYGPAGLPRLNETAIDIAGSCLHRRGRLHDGTPVRAPASRRRVADGPERVSQGCRAWRRRGTAATPGPGAS